jgi:3-dehydroquinate dehydratase
MNDADFELLKAEAFAHTVRHDVALAAAVSRIERDLALMMQAVNRIEESVMLPPGGWNHDDIELSDPPF